MNRHRGKLVAHSRERCRTGEIHLLRVRVMPDHVHILIRKHKHQAEDMIDHLQAASRERV